VPDIVEPPPVPAEGERYRLLEAASNLFTNIAARQTTVLMLDDLHWADKGTIAMLRHVARIATKHALLLVGAYRDVELDRTHPLAEVLATLRRETNYERIVLKGLGAADVGEFLGLVAEQRVPEEFVRAISDETGGNPFFIREVMFHLVDEKKIVQEDGRWISAVSIADMRIPEGVREVIGRRLSRVTDTCGRMLTVASALTAGFSWETISALLDAGDAALLDAVDEALGAQLIVEHERGRYDFTHALIRHTLYEELSTPRRVLLHRQIGEALERLYADDLEPHLAELAHHFFEATQPALAGKEVAYASRAAGHAEAIGAHDEAATLYDRALQASEMHSVGDDAARCEIMLSLARAQFHAGQFGVENTDIYLRAAALAKVAGLNELGRALRLVRGACGPLPTSGSSPNSKMRSLPLTPQTQWYAPERSATSASYSAMTTTFGPGPPPKRRFRWRGGLQMPARRRTR
jgi:predicted ATPase